jgi:hypothetical protein
MGDVALSDVLLKRAALSIEVARATTVEAGVVGGIPSGRWHMQAQHRQR